MYAPHFGFSKEPFSIAPDPRFLYLSEKHREALAHLLYGLSGGGGFVLLTGEIGAGKTTVCRCFLEQVPPTCSVAYIFNPKLTAAELLQTVCAEFGLLLTAALGPHLQDGHDRPDELAVGPAPSIKALVDTLNAFLLDQHAQGRQAVLVIDEAQSLSPDVLEQLRLLTNLETAERKLLQIVLIGQPELRDMLARPELAQLAQRVIARFHLGALTAAETSHYIRHRISVAGLAWGLPFDGPALARIHALSRGVPRRINLLADRALLGAYAQGRQRADRRTVERAAAEIFAASLPKAATRRRIRALAPVLALVLALSLTLLAALAWSLKQQPSAALDATAAPRLTDAARAMTASTQVEAARETGIGAALGGAASDAPSLVTPALPTAGASSAGPVPQGVSSDPADLLAAALATPALAWRQLALRWKVSVGEGEPCVAVRQAQLACLHSASGGLPLVRQLARPGLLTLRGPRGTPVYALLTGLGPARASLQVGQRRFELSLPALASVWQGDFDTFWHPPPAWRAEAGNAVSPALQEWIDRQLAASGHAAPHAASAPLAARIRAFQLAQGLPADGTAGPLTLIALQRPGADAALPEPSLALLGATP